MKSIYRESNIDSQTGKTWKDDRGIDGIDEQHSVLGDTGSEPSGLAPKAKRWDVTVLAASLWTGCGFAAASTLVLLYSGGCRQALTSRLSHPCNACGGRFVPTNSLPESEECEGCAPQSKIASGTTLDVGYSIFVLSAKSRCLRCRCFCCFC